MLDAADHGGDGGEGIVGLRQIGLGGIGSGAVQGARLAGAEKIIVIDPIPAKQQKAFEFGATHFVTSMPEAMALVADLTKGVMADSSILTVGLLEGAMLEDAANLVRKGGAVVMTALGRMADSTPTLNMMMFTLFQKRLLGSLYGEANPRADIPRLLSLYRDGKLLLDETVTHEYTLAEVNQGRVAVGPQPVDGDDDGPLPDVYTDVIDGQRAMRATPCTDDIGTANTCSPWLASTSSSVGRSAVAARVTRRSRQTRCVRSSLTTSAPASAPLASTSTSSLPTTPRTSAIA